MKPPAEKPSQPLPPPVVPRIAAGAILLLALWIGFAIVISAAWRLMRPAEVAARDTGSSSLPSSASARDETFVSDDAAELLTAAAAAEPGYINVRDDIGALTIWGGERKFCQPKDGGRETARWQAALKKLHQAALIEPASFMAGKGQSRSIETWRVTKAGYAAADAIRTAQ